MFFQELVLPFDSPQDELLSDLDRFLSKRVVLAESGLDVAVVVQGFECGDGEAALGEDHAVDAPEPHRRQRPSRHRIPGLQNDFTNLALKQRILLYFFTVCLDYKAAFLNTQVRTVAVQHYLLNFYLAQSLFSAKINALTAKKEFRVRFQPLEKRIFDFRAKHGFCWRTEK